MKGFTIIELLVVIAIIGILATLMLLNFSRSRVDLNQVANMVRDAVREAQSDALSGALVHGTYRCGYGIHFEADHFTIFAGPDATQPGVDCTTGLVLSSQDVTPVVRTGFLENNSLEIVLPAPDIFFEPPNPTTYIAGDASPGKSADINIRVKNAACPSTDCRTIHVTTAGLIQ